jgi:hypothetical protein
MTPFLAAVTLLSGALMLATGTRRRFPCFAGGVAALVAGGFTLGLPIMDSIGAWGWIWFCAWLAALPVILGCGVALAVILRRGRSVFRAWLLCCVAFATSVPPAMSFREAAGFAGDGSPLGSPPGITAGSPGRFETTWA